MHSYSRQGSLYVHFAQHVLFVHVRHFAELDFSTELSLLHQQVTCLLATLRRLADILILGSLVSAAGSRVKTQLQSS